MLSPVRCYTRCQPTLVRAAGCAECFDMSALFSASFSICLKDSSKALYLNCTNACACGLSLLQTGSQGRGLFLLPDQACTAEKIPVLLSAVTRLHTAASVLSDRLPQTQAQAPESARIEVKYFACRQLRKLTSQPRLTLCNVHFIVYALPEGGVYEKLLSPSRSSNRQVLISAFTGSPRRAANWIVHNRAPPLVNMQKESSMI